MGDRMPEPEATPAEKGVRRIEVDLAGDGRIVVASLGGGMPVAIRLSREEAVAVRARIDAILGDETVAGEAAG